MRCSASMRTACPVGSTDWPLRLAAWSTRNCACSCEVCRRNDSNASRTLSASYPSPRLGRSSRRGSAVSEGCCPGSCVAICGGSVSAESMQVSSVGQAPALTLCRLEADSQLVQSFLRRPSGSTCQRIGAARGLRIGDHLSDVRLTREQRDEALDPERKPSVGRGSHAQGSEEPAELGVRLVLGHSHRPEDALLDLLPVDSDRAGPELPAVPGQVVGLAERG